MSGSKALSPNSYKASHAFPVVYSVSLSFPGTGYHLSHFPPQTSPSSSARPPRMMDITCSADQSYQKTNRLLPPTPLLPLGEETSLRNFRCNFSKQVVEGSLNPIPLVQSPVVVGHPKPIPSDPVGDPWCSLLLLSSCFHD